MTCDSEKFVPLNYVASCDLMLCEKKQQHISATDWAVLSEPHGEIGLHTELLTRYRLVTCAELRTVDDYLRALEVSDHPMFATIGFSEKLAMHTRFQGALNPFHFPPELLIEAARFALAHVQTAPAFVAHYQFYLCCTKKLGLDSFAASIRIARVNLVQEALLLSIKDCLDGPVLEGQIPPELILEKLAEWIAQGNHLGFCDAASGLWLTAQHLSLPGLSYTEITRAAKDFVRHMQVFFCHHHATCLQLAQTGEHWVYEFDYPEAQASLHVSAEGCLTVSAYKLVCAQLLHARMTQ